VNFLDLIRPTSGASIDKYMVLIILQNLIPPPIGTDLSQTGRLMSESS
jgi:hypothetical protein